MPDHALHGPALRWYDDHARDLPWRRADASAWSVLVSEFMLQQTPVTRVLPVFETWMSRWPTPIGLAAAATGDAIRAWGRLGYPRRALRLHATAVAITTRHGGEVPDDIASLRALPGVGDYTAAAVASFAFGRRHIVLDTNVRRVLARVVQGTELPAPSVTAAERAAAESLLPDDEATAARWSVAVMELGALCCTTSAPRCRSCPVAALCRWRLGGFPAHVGPQRRRQTYAGTDRQCRGRLLGVLREADGPVPRTALVDAWEPSEQRDRALDSLVADGLVEPLADEVFCLPTGQ